ncbi:MAG TPA: hypothetical protein PKE52_14820, partial [Bacteroidales bacterium]|nr:hypothetical protein [Bacteroidales bacterium]
MEGFSMGLLYFLLMEYYHHLVDLELYSIWSHHGYSIKYATRRALKMRSYGLLLFPLFWIAFEWWHMNWDLSWPWLNLGNGFGAYPKMIQWYEFTGILGGSLWVLLVN